MNNVQCSIMFNVQTYQRPAAPPQQHYAPSNPDPVYIPAPSQYNKPPIIIYQGVRPPVHVYEKPNQQPAKTHYQARAQAKVSAPAAPVASVAPAARAPVSHAPAARPQVARNQVVRASVPRAPAAKVAPKLTQTKPANSRSGNEREGGRERQYFISFFLSRLHHRGETEAGLQHPRPDQAGGHQGARPVPVPRLTSHPQHHPLRQPGCGQRQGGPRHQQQRQVRRGEGRRVGLRLGWEPGEARNCDGHHQPVEPVLVKRRKVCENLNFVVTLQHCIVQCKNLSQTQPAHWAALQAFPTLRISEM